MVSAFLPPLGVKRFGAQLECVLLTALASGNARSPRQPHKRCSRGARPKQQRRPQAVSQRVLSALGQKRTFAMQKGMSALPPEADIVRPIQVCIWLSVYEYTA
jgi:hypothetical protein